MFTFDIETVPLLDALAVPYDPATNPAPANYKSEDAIAKWHVTAADAYRTNRIKQCSLNPRLGRILCAGYKLDDEPAQSFLAETEVEEEPLLVAIWALIAQYGSQIVTWNGQFDLRFLVVRSLAHGVNPTVAVPQWFKRYSFHPHCDVKTFLLQEWGSRVAGEGLDEWSAFFKLGDKTHTGADVYMLYYDGKFDDVRRYCEQDVELTATLYHKIHAYL